MDGSREPVDQIEAHWLILKHIVGFLIVVGRSCLAMVIGGFLWRKQKISLTLTFAEHSSKSSYLFVRHEKIKS